MALFIANQTKYGGDVQMAAADWRALVARLRKTPPNGAAVALAIEGRFPATDDGRPWRIALTADQIVTVERVMG